MVVCHAIANHFGGAQSIREMHIEMGFEPPIIHKKIDNNEYEREIFAKSPGLKEKIRELKDGDTFYVKEKINGIEFESTLGVIETPGHRKDHCSFFLKNDKL